MAKKHTGMLHTSSHQGEEGRSHCSLARTAGIKKVVPKGWEAVQELDS